MSSESSPATSTPMGDINRPESSGVARAAHVEQALEQMREALGDLSQYSYQELHDLMSYFQEFCVTLEDEAMSKESSDQHEYHDTDHDSHHNRLSF